MSQGNEDVEGAVGGTPFNFEDWAKQHQLSRKTTGALRQDECDKEASLRLLTGHDINRINVPVGQIRLLRLGLRALGNPILVNDHPDPTGDPPVHPENREEETEGDANTQALNQAGQELEDLLDGGIIPDGEGNLKTSAATKPLLPRGGVRPSATTYVSYDPLMHLTVKATKVKALQIANFLPEAARLRVNRRKKDQFTFTTTPGGALSLKTEDTQKVYVTLDEWSGANMRLCAQLLKEGQIQESELVYYMAYTAMISDLAGQYEWSSVLEYDTRYRELQAEHLFLWGTPHPHTERHLLVPRQQGRQVKDRAGSQGGEKAKSKPLCRDYMSKWGCNFGNNCKYRHEYPEGSAKVPPKVTPPKNE